MITPKKRRVTLSVRIKPEAAETVAALAKHYSTSQGQVIEQLLLTYGPTILEKK